MEASNGDEAKCGGIPIPHMAFSQFSGILLTSFVRINACARTHARTHARTQVIFVFYAVYSKNQIYCNKKIIFPTLISGMMWALSQVAGGGRLRTTAPCSMPAG